MAWLPEHGVGMFAMANLTYAGPAQAINEAFDVLGKTGALQKRELPVSPVLAEMRERIFRLWNSWSEDDAKQIGAMNLLLDQPSTQRKAEIDRLKADVGQCSAAGPVVPENSLRGRFNLTCEKGDVVAVFTLAPVQPPTMQYLAFRRTMTPPPPVRKVSCSDQ